MPMVSVIIPTYNRAHFLHEAIDSVLAQTFGDFEIIVVDDGSTDETMDCVKSYGGRVHYVHQKNAGPSMARNRGIAAAQGRYVAFLDSDDFFYPDKLEKQVVLMEKDPSLAFTFTNYSQGERPMEPRRGWIRENLLDNSDIFSSLCRDGVVCYVVTVLARREELLAAGLFDPTMRAAEDYDLWLRLAHFKRGQYLPEILTHVRDHGERTMRSLAFHRNYCQAYRMQLLRWHDGAALPSQRHDLKNRYIKSLTQLAWCQRQNGRIRDSGRTFMLAAYNDCRSARWQDGLRGAVYWALPWIVSMKQWFDRVRRRPSAMREELPDG